MPDVIEWLTLSFFTIVGTTAAVVPMRVVMVLYYDIMEYMTGIPLP
jgi:hypothetical protein